MIEDAQVFTVNVSPAFLGLDTGEGDIPHKLYYLEARAGGGGSPTYADSTLITYRGSLLNGTLFDQSQDFMWFPLYSRILGFAHGIANMKAASPDQIIENGDGTITFGNSGIGLFILPSGLAYYNGSGPSGSLPTYSPLMFQIELGAYVEHTDTDGDGVPNIEEDINKNGFLRDDDTDQDGQFDFIDVDDDGDKILIRLEISNAEGVIIKPYPDTNGDGIPDYLDPKNK